MENKKKNIQKLPTKCWLVEITPKGCDMLQFYVTAKDQNAAYEKADAYAEIMEHESLRKFYGTSFRLLP